MPPQQRDLSDWVLAVLGLTCGLCASALLLAGTVKILITMFW